MTKITFTLKHFILLITITLLSACGGGSGGDIKDAGNTPEYAAQRFFYAIFIDKDMETVQKYATPKLKRLLKGYGSINGIKRNMLNMNFDTVEISIERTGNLRENYGDTATLTLIFNGMYNGNKVSDFRDVKLEKKGVSWLVAKVKDDPYAR